MITTGTTREFESIAEATAAAAQATADQAPGRFLATPDVYRAEIATALQAEQPAWLRRVRQAGADALERQGFPTPRHEDWHYTSTAAIAEAAFPTLTAASGDVSAAELEPFAFGHADWPTLVFVNGRFDARLSRLDTLPDGVRALPLARALVEQPETVERVLGRIADAAAHPFVALNQALLVDGALLTVAKEMEAEVPVHLLYVTDASGARGTTHPRTLVVAERHSKLTVIESHVALGDAAYFTNHVTEIDVADGATVTHLKLQRESERAFHVAHVEARQGRDSHFVSFSYAVGAHLSRTNVYTLLGGEGCGATLNGLYLVDGEQHCDHQTRIEHARPNCYSRELYKGILDGRSHGVFNGKVYVHPVAQKTDGKQTNNTLLLSADAQIDTKP
ncbi:MAG TPA: SufD family Fe-S cluster assembly protein, partial [Gemmatirosa sp.]|nr:SufD family Fe-S cluster assembly protein [Gemmatirosa sp.]